MFCWKCGYEIEEDDAQFCPKCGAKMETEIDTGKKSKLPILIGVIGGVSVLAVVAVILVMTGVLGDGPGENVVMTQETAAPEQSTDDISKESQPTDSESAAKSESTAGAESAPETDTKDEETVDEASSGDGFLRPSRVECKTLCKELYATEPVKTADKDDLRSMCCQVLPLLLPQEEVYFNKIDKKELTNLEYDTAYSSIVEQSPGYSILKPKKNKNYGYVFNKQELLEYWSKFFDRDPSVPIQYVGVQKETEDTVTLAFGDGILCYYYPGDVTIYENESYYLVAGALESEYEEDYPLECQVLIRKRDWEYPGTIVYCTTKLDRIPISGISASSTLPSSGENTYKVSNLIDGDRRTAWCENQRGVGKGVTLRISLVDTRVVHGIALMNGYHKNKPIYKKNGKVMDLSFSAKEGETETLKQKYVPDSFWNNGQLGKYTYLDLKKPVKTNEITLKILSAVCGSKYDDTCISELFVY
ncbi:MAG: zinc ribbon domain-containing protein [Eubacterium sp.]|nr:zinc ribbon domain-containing protein [Eubacterium sp.]